MDFTYLITPFIAWLVAGCLKFLINSLKQRSFAFGLVGYGGLPSNHTSIVTAMPTLIYLKNGFNNPAFGVAITIAFIVILDASSLRRQVGYHAASINKIYEHDQSYKELRERIGHTPFEIFSGFLVGVLVAHFVFYFT